MQRSALLILSANAGSSVFQHVSILKKLGFSCFAQPSIKINENTHKPARMPIAELYRTTSAAYWPDVLMDPEVPGSIPELTDFLNSSEAGSGSLILEGITDQLFERKSRGCDLEQRD
jgi:hypothetical protein